MSMGVPDPEDCQSLADVAAGVEQADREIIAQLSRRFAYMRAAARFKPDLPAITDDAPHRAHVMSARRAAFELGVPVGLVGEFWDRLTDASMAYERQAWERLHAPDD